MPENNDIKSYVLVIDKDRDLILNYMMSAASDNPKFIRTIKNNNMFGALKSLVEDCADKSHPLGWCNDPECTWKPKEEKA